MFGMNADFRWFLTKCFLSIESVSVKASGAFLELCGVFGREDALSLHRLNTSFSIDQIRKLIITMAGCKQCWSAFPLVSCVDWPEADEKGDGDNRVPCAKPCEHKEFPNHAWPSIRAKRCGGDLVKVIQRPRQEPRIQALLPVVIYPIVEWFFRLTRVRGFRDKIEYPREQLKQWKQGDPMSEIWHGRAWQELLMFEGQPLLSAPRVVALIMFLDGIGAFKTRRYSLWAVIFAIANLARYMRWRRKYVHLAQLLPGGTDSSDTNRLMAPIAEQLKALFRGVLFEGELWRFPLLQITGDAPARAKANARQYISGTSGCVTCPVKFHVLDEKAIEALFADDALNVELLDQQIAGEGADGPEERKADDEGAPAEPDGGGEEKKRKPPKRLNFFTDWDSDLGLRDSDQMRADCARYRHATTYEERKQITKETGARDSCLLRELPHFKPPMHVATDGFHTVYPNTCGVSALSFWQIC
jgi:hypothetical protein